MTLDTSSQNKWFYIRPRFLAALSLWIAVPVVVIYFGILVSHNHVLKMFIWMSSILALLTGWYFLLKDHEPHSRWRAWIALITSIYLAASLPTFLFEISPFRWFVIHPMHREFSGYVLPWIYWGRGSIFVLAGVAGSLCGRGRARAAFLLTSVLLLTLWFATMPWIR
jgi:hypothetical protein